MTTATETSAQRWPTAQFGDVLRRVERKVTIDDAREYATVGVRWYGRGAFVRERLLGADIAAKQQAVIKTGDVVYNKLFAWKGSFAVADHAVDGHLISGEFPTYEFDRARLDPRYLSYFFQTPELGLQAARLSRGAAAISRLRLNPSQFAELRIPLPPLREQERLVEVLSDAEAKLQEARWLRREAEAEAAALVTSAIGERLAELPITGTLGQVLTEKPRNGWSALCDNAHGGTPVLSVGAVTGFTYRPTEFKRTSLPTVPDAHYWLTEGDLLMTRANTQQLVGHVAFYDGRPSPCIYPDKMMRIKVDTERADPRFVYYWLRTPAVRAVLEAAATGTSSSMRNITQQEVIDLLFPVETGLIAQRAAVDELDEIVSRIEDARATQRSAELDLAALMPALLDRALQGELRTVVADCPGPSAARAGRYRPLPT